MPEFNVLDQPGVQKALTARSLLQLWQTSFFLKAGATQYNGDDTFSQYSKVSVMRPRLSGEAEDYNPRNIAGNAAIERELEYVNVEFGLDKLFTTAVPIFSTDANLERYVRDYSNSGASQLRTSAEKYLYESAFRNYLLPASGSYRYGKNPPVQLAWRESATGQLLPMTRQLLVRAGSMMRSQEVPSSDLYAALSPDSVGDLFVNSPTDESFAGVSAGSSGLLANGLPDGSFISRHGFMVGTSTVVKGQPGVANLSGGQPSVAIASVTQDNAVFIQEDSVGSVPLGAVEIVVSAAFSPSSIGVGQIVRIGANSTEATAYGVVLRVAGTSIFVVPYGSNGNILKAAQITVATDRISVPDLPNINPAFHREHLIFASRRLRPPSEGGGAVSEVAQDPESGMILQVVKGGYDPNRFKETCRMSILMGATSTDHRKGALMLAS